ncbi:MAG TPA: GPR endopeptidase, partial [Clostridiales bacterium]|nr:GPR endopeptidase [Clostridiales bacterium]
IAIDALAARRLSRLGNTVQMSDTGVSPGSGVGNARTELSEKTLGVKVISMGVPTVVDAVTLVTDVLGEQNAARMGDIQIDQEFGRMMVTPREIDLMTERAAKLIALSINTALQPSLSLDDILSLI